MPKDANGRPLAVGDIVLVRFRVLEVLRGEQADRVRLLGIDLDGARGFQPLVECPARMVEQAEA